MSKFAYLSLCGLICLGLGCDDDDPAAANEDNTGDLPTTVNPPLAPIDTTDDAMAATLGGRADMPMTDWNRGPDSRSWGTRPPAAGWGCALVVRVKGK